MSDQKEEFEVEPLTDEDLDSASGGGRSSTCPTTHTCPSTSGCPAKEIIAEA